MMYFDHWLMAIQISLLLFQSSYSEVPSTTFSPVTVDSKPVKTSGGRGIETEVLGPLRVWHLVGIIATILTIGLIIVCCCWNFRIPRTRQEIDENYQKRVANKQYLRALERNPEQLLKRQEGKSGQPESETSAKVRPPKLLLSGIKPTAGHGATHTNGKMPMAGGPAVDPTNIKTGEYSGYLPTSRPRPTGTFQTPLAMHPQYILSLMSKQNKKTNKHQPNPS